VRIKERTGISNGTMLSLSTCFNKRTHPRDQRFD